MISLATTSSIFLTFYKYELKSWPLQYSRIIKKWFSDLNLSIILTIYGELVVYKTLISFSMDFFYDLLISFFLIAFIATN